MVNIGYNGEGDFERRIQAAALNDFGKDDVKEEIFHSQTFEVRTKGEKFLRYRAKDKKESNVDYALVNADIIEDQNEFQMYELIKIVVRNEDAKKSFKIDIDFEADCLIDKIYIKKSESGKYLIYTQEAGKDEFSVTIENEGITEIPEEPKKDEETKEPDKSEETEKEEPPIIKEELEKIDKDKLKEEIKKEIIEEITKEIIENVQKELLEKLKQENNKEVIIQTVYEEQKNKQEEAGDLKVLPRTGNDYFILKLIIADTILFLIVLSLILIKKQTTNLKAVCKFKT